MNTPIFTCEKSSTKKNSTSTMTRVCSLFFASGIICGLMSLVYVNQAQAEWKVDFSRRAKPAREVELNAAGRVPASSARPQVSDAPRIEITPEEPEKKQGMFDALFEAGEPVQDVVIMHTDKGFVPSTVRVRKNGHYRIHIVNVNDKEKNVSFILDGFSEHHATYYGKIKTFTLEPKKEGAFSFLSPETSSEGKLVVFNPQITVRTPASEESAK